jgi:hypothetical protein
MTEPAIRLYSAVVYGALEDLFFPRADIPSQIERNRLEALSFLTDTSGPWHRSRCQICAIIDIDPDRLRTKIIDFLDGTTAFKRLHWKGAGQIDSARSEKNLRIAQALWANRHAPTIRRRVDLEPENRVPAFEPESIDAIRARSERILDDLEARKTAA